MQDILQPCLGADQHEQTCFANVFHSGNSRVSAKSLLHSGIPVTHLKENATPNAQKKFCATFLSLPILAVWKTGLLADKEKGNLCQPWADPPEKLFMQSPRIQFRMYATKITTKLLYEADRSKLSKHRPYAEGSLSMCLNANTYQIIPIIPN